MAMLTLKERDALRLAHNPPDAAALADDKVLTADLCRRAGLPTPPALAVIAGMDDWPPPLPGDFVVKPARGSGGSGIVVVTDRRGDRYATGDGRTMPPAALTTHVGNILSGLYSKGGLPDRALVQGRVTPAPFFAALAPCGLADIRVIVFCGRPVMAMLRLPTRESGGQGNLHAGAVGVGIDLASGLTNFAVYRNGAIDRHPDTGQALAGIALPDWPAVPALAAAAANACGLGYAGVDLVVDAAGGLLVLEINAAPGLGIQLANRASLREALVDAN